MKRRNKEYKVRVRYEVEATVTVFAKSEKEVRDESNSIVLDELVCPATGDIVDWNIESLKEVVE